MSRCLKECLISSPVLWYPSFDKRFIIETDVSQHGLDVILSQEQCDHKLHPVAYASNALSSTDKWYAITDLETLVAVREVTHFHAYFYEHDVLVYTDHSTVKAVQEKSSAMLGGGVSSLIVTARYQDCLPPTKRKCQCWCFVLVPHSHCSPPDSIVDDTAQIARLELSSLVITDLLDTEPITVRMPHTINLARGQRKDPFINQMISFLTERTLPSDVHHSKKKTAARSLSFYST